MNTFQAPLLLSAKINNQVPNLMSPELLLTAPQTVQHPISSMSRLTDGGSDLGDDGGSIYGGQRGNKEDEGEFWDNDEILMIKGLSSGMVEGVQGAWMMY